MTTTATTNSDDLASILRPLAEMFILALATIGIFVFGYEAAVTNTISFIDFFTYLLVFWTFLFTIWN